VASRFQSSLELSPECNEALAGSLGVSLCFNPHSSFRPSATRWAASNRAALRKFQSSLELSPECNDFEAVAVHADLGFQSSLELSPECNESYFGKDYCVVLVSILTRAFARVQPRALK